MKTLVIPLFAVLAPCTLAFAQDVKSDLSNELRAQGIKPSIFLETTLADVISAVHRIGGETILEESPTFFKLKYETKIRIYDNTTPHIVLLDEANQILDYLSPTAAEDITASALIQLKDQPPRQQIEMKLICLAASGQGLPEVGVCGLQQSN